MNYAQCIDPITLHISAKAAGAPIKLRVAPPKPMSLAEKKARFLACLRAGGKTRAQLIAETGFLPAEIDRQIYGGTRTRTVRHTGSRRRRVYWLR